MLEDCAGIAISVVAPEAEREALILEAHLGRHDDTFTSRTFKPINVVE
jgi:hypothetical protein